MAKATDKTETKKPTGSSSQGKTPAKDKGAATQAKSGKQSVAKAEGKQPAPKPGKSAAKAQPKSAPKVQQKASLPRLKKLYRDKIIADIHKQAGYKNIWQVPRLVKIVLNMGLGNAREDGNMLKSALNDLAVITGQKALVTYAKKPISNFKIRTADPVGAKVTLRNDRMYEFLDRLLALAIPRVRDFRGLPASSFDGRGNYSFGITEQIVFPEIDYDKIDQIRGMDITLVTTAKTDEEAYELMRAFGFPFRARPPSQTASQGANA